MLCPKCGEERSTMMRKVAIDDADVRIRRCRSCGHVYYTTERISGDIQADPPESTNPTKSTPPTRAA